MQGKSGAEKSSATFGCNRVVTNGCIQVLESRGVMEKLRAQVRAELFAELNLSTTLPAVMIV